MTGPPNETAFPQMEVYLFSYRLTSLILGFVIAGIIIRLVRKDLLHTRYSLLWFFIAISIGGFGAFPRLNDMLASTLGVNYPPIFLVVAGICVIFLKILTMDIDRSRQERKIRILNEKIAVMEAARKVETDSGPNIPAPPAANRSE